MVCSGVVGQRTVWLGVYEHFVKQATQKTTGQWCHNRYPSVALMYRKYTVTPARWVGWLGYHARDKIVNTMNQFIYRPIAHTRTYQDQQNNALQDLQLDSEKIQFPTQN